MSEDLYAEWDGAYVLGALSPAERREFERHLAGCAQCSAAVQELAGMPGLLASVPVSKVEAAARHREAPESDAPDSLLPQLISRVRRSAFRRRITVATGLAAAACVAIAALVFAQHSGSPGVVAQSGTGSSTASAAPTTTPSTPGSAVSTPPSSSAGRSQLTLVAVLPSPLSAGVVLVARPWGTEIRLTCNYARDSSSPPSGDEDARPYAMVVTDRQGDQMQVATWNAGPGTTTWPTASTSLAIDQIASIEVETTPGIVLLRGTR